MPRFDGTGSLDKPVLNEENELPIDLSYWKPSYYLKINITQTVFEFFKN